MDDGEHVLHLVLPVRDDTMCANIIRAIYPLCTDWIEAWLTEGDVPNSNRPQVRL